LVRHQLLFAQGQDAQCIHFYLIFALKRVAQQFDFLEHAFALYQ